MAYYVDTSALVKLVVAEPETKELRAWIRKTKPTLITCDLTRTELLRAVIRVDRKRIVQAREVLDGLFVATVGTAVFESAARIEPSALRSLDALHIASALELGDDLEGLVAYDARLTDAANSQGIQVLAP